MGGEVRNHICTSAMAWLWVRLLSTAWTCSTMDASASLSTVIGRKDNNDAAYPRPTGSTPAAQPGVKKRACVCPRHDAPEHPLCQHACRRVVQLCKGRRHLGVGREQQGLTLLQRCPRGALLL